MKMRSGNTPHFLFYLVCIEQKPARIFARKGIDAVLRNSFGVCWRPPLAPIPQIDGIPAAWV